LNLTDKKSRQVHKGECFGAKMRSKSSKKGKGVTCCDTAHRNWLLRGGGLFNFKRRKAPKGK